MNTIVNKAIENSRRIVPQYWESTVKGRLNGGIGSVYDQFSSVEELEKALLAADWRETTHPDVMTGCRVFVANLEGRFGIVEISELPSDTVLIADDRKNTGCVAMTVEGIRGKIVSETYLIMGEEQGEDVVFTFHPGEPIRPSVVEVSTISHGSRVSVKEAKELGFDLAKIV